MPDDTPELPPILGDDELATPELPPEEGGTPPDMETVPEQSPDDSWVPPTREQWEHQQELIAQAHKVVSMVHAEKLAQGKIAETPAADDPWESDEELKETDKDERRVIEKQVQAVLRKLGIDPKELAEVPKKMRRTEDAERYQAFERERQSVRLTYGSAEVDALDPTIQKMLETRQLTYEEAFHIAKAKRDRERRSQTANTMDAERRRKLAAQQNNAAGAGLGRPAVVHQTGAVKVPISATTAHGSRDLGQMLKELEASGEELFSVPGA